MLLAENLAGQPNLLGGAFNFSNEAQITVLELVNMISNIMNSSLKPKILNESTGEILHQYLSAEKARRILGWKPKFSLHQGLSRTIKWYEKLLTSRF